MRRKNIELGDLEKAGWTRRFIAEEPRLSEAVAMYRQAGFEVRLEPLSKVSGGRKVKRDMGVRGRECRDCYSGVEHLHKTIYTRPLKDMPGEEDRERTC